MSFQWNFLATFLYAEIVAVIILLLPFISPGRWQKVFKSRLALGLAAGARYYFNFIIVIFVLLFFDSIRELRKHSAVEVKDASSPYTEAHAHMKQFRSQRNFYIAGFALFLWFVFRRLINLISTCAREIANSNALLKQAEGAQRHLERNPSQDSKKTDPRGTVASSGNPPQHVESKELVAEIEKYKREAIKAKEDLEILRERYTNSIEECDKIKEENRKSQIKLAMLSGDESSKNK